VAASLLHARVKDHEVVHYLKESGLGTHLAQRAVIGLRYPVYGLPVALSFDLQRAKPVIEQLFWHRDYRVVTDHPISPRLVWVGWPTRMVGGAMT
jgi:hypothetical protein